MGVNMQFNRVVVMVFKAYDSRTLRQVFGESGHG
jgi:hypothetical protein